MAKFAYNDVKNASTEYILFQLNCKYYLRTFQKDNVNSYSKLKSIDEFIVKLKNLISTYGNNFCYV